MTASAVDDISGNYLPVVDTGNREKGAEAQGNACVLEFGRNTSTSRFRDRPPCHRLQITAL